MAMGKMVSIYLTDREADDLRRFCEDHSCTQYSALKTALHELLMKPVEAREKIVKDNESQTRKELEVDRRGEAGRKSFSYESTRARFKKLLGLEE